MSLKETVLAQVRARSPLRVMPEPPLPALTPTWADASVRRISAALDRAQQRDDGEHRDGAPHGVLPHAAPPFPAPRRARERHWRAQPSTVPTAS